MRTIGAHEAKTHLARLLDEVAGGETITITKHGVPVARLVPVSGPRKDVRETIVALRELRQTIKPLVGLSIREMIEEGRRF